jgi:hypothetical protein
MKLRVRRRHFHERFWWQDAAGVSRPYDWSTSPRKRYGRSMLMVWEKLLRRRYVF